MRGGHLEWGEPRVVGGGGDLRGGPGIWGGVPLGGGGHLGWKDARLMGGGEEGK